jgi:hypothetical protein
MLRLRFSLTSLLLAITFVSLCVAVWKSYHGWYAHNYSDEVLSRLLHDAVRNGDSVEPVADHLGVTGVNIDAERASFGAGFQGVIRKLAANRPYGVHTTDKFLYFGFGRYGAVLQFRDDRLINHEPTKFGGSSAIDFQKVRETPVYDKLLQLGWQMGVLQGIAGLVAGSTLIAAIALAKRRRYSPVALKAMIAVPSTLCVGILCLAIQVRPYSLLWLIVGFTGLVVWHGLGHVRVGPQNDAPGRALSNSTCRPPSR